MKLSGKSASAAKLFNSVHKAQVSWKRIRPLLAPVEEAPKTAAKIQKEESGAALHLRHVTFAYPNGAPILKDISFSVKPGQIIGITGAVACGKSTLGKVFLCEYPYEGEIRLGDTELRELSCRERCEAVGYLGHDPELFNDSIEHNVLLGEKKDPELYLKAVCIDAEVNEMPDKKRTLVGNGGVRLSGGQAQRLALARTLCHLRPVMILDDPFSALDKKTEAEIFSNIRQLAGDAIVLLISHRLYLFPQLDQIVWMEGGRAIAAPHETLIKEVPEYAALFEGRYTQEGGAEHEV